MATLASLRTALTTRLGLVSLTTTETNRIDEALNGAVARTYGDGLPGLDESYTGSVQGSLAVTVSAHSGGSATVTLDTTSGVFPRDFFTLDGTDYLIRGVNGSDIDLGIPVASTLSGSGTITRRALELPHSGQVLGVQLVDSYGGRPLKPYPQGDIKAPFDSGAEPTHFSQHWSADQDKSYLTLYPAPSTSEQVAVRQRRANAEDADIDAPYSALEHILAIAHILYLTWTGAHDGSGIGMALKDQKETADLKHTSHDGGVRSR